MKQPVYLLILLAACGGDFSPVISDSATSTTSSAAEAGTANEGGDEMTGGSGGSSDDTGPDAGSDGSSPTDGGTSDTDEMPPENPGPLERCDPLLVAAGEQACEVPDDGHPHSCTPVIVDKGPGPDFADIWGYRCAFLEWWPSDEYTGPDVGDHCWAAQYSYEGTWKNPCQDSMCQLKYSYPPDPSFGQKILPDSFCPDLPTEPGGYLPGNTGCCTEMCLVGEANACGAGMKCLPRWTHSLEDDAPAMGICVSQDYDPNQP